MAEFAPEQMAQLEERFKAWGTSIVTAVLRDQKTADETRHREILERLNTLEGKLNAAANKTDIEAVRTELAQLKTQVEKMGTSDDLDTQLAQAKKEREGATGLTAKALDTHIAELEKQIAARKAGTDKVTTTKTTTESTTEGPIRKWLREH